MNATETEDDLRREVTRLREEVAVWKARALHCEGNIAQARSFATECHEKWEAARDELTRLRGRWGSAR